ncbi:MAG: PorT family protein, partial [Bacteroidia bacterium]
MSLRKILVIISLALLSLIPLQAQWQIGGLIGFNIAGISVPTGTVSEDYSSKLGFGIGAVVDRPLTNQIILHLEPMYLQKGGTIKTSSFTLKYKVNYIELPIMIKYAFLINSTLVPYAMAGPSIGLLTGAKYEDDEGYIQDEKDNTNGFDFGLGLGGGVSYPHGNMIFFAETRYVFGLANINKESDEST